ncbi:putative SERF-like protein [Arctopsyche grandis]|uniref:putative SERF-like protein n=1 Tax=Arctopsyche grandis TaxID=121162 RepID=UPI00406D6C61
MTRGNQRDLARAKNQKKQLEQSKKKNAGEKNGMTLEQRKFRDAELMREKQKKKEDDAAEQSSTAKS